MPPKTILLIIDGLAGGGAEKVVLTLAEAMAAQGHAVTLLLLRAACAYALPVGVQVETLVDDYTGPLRRQTEIARRARQLDRWVRQHFAQQRLDLVIASLPKTDRIVAHCPSLRGRAWHCLHGAISAELTRKRGVSRWLKRRQLYQTYHRCKLLTVSAGLLPDLHAACGAQPAQAVTLPNPFDFAAIRAAAQAPCPLDGQPFLLHVGRFHPVKRHDRLFEAVKCSGYQGKLVLLGQGAPADTARLQAAAAHAGVADQVVWAGFVANPYPYLRAAQAVVLSSDFEGFGNVLVEALACGTPVVSTRCPYGPAEILTGDLARGLSDLTASDLACALNAVLAAPPQPTAAQLDRFALDNVVSRYLALADAEGGFTV